MARLFALASSCLIAACLAASVAARPVEIDGKSQVPTPQPRPELPSVDEQATPVPTPRPSETQPDPESFSQEPPPQASDAVNAACRERLAGLGAVFREIEPEMSEASCPIPRALLVSRLSPSIAIEPEVVMTCAMAETAARFIIGEGDRLARSKFGDGIKVIHQASGYVCRARNDGSKMSEHAFANALDIAAFELSDGRRVAVSGASAQPEAGFLQAVRDAACGPFRTVLGPGADADHAEHLHFDLAVRSNDRPFCQ